LKNPLRSLVHRNQKDSEIKCEKMFRYDTLRFKTPDVKFGPVAVGESNIEYAVLRTANEAILKLDGRQYLRCITIRNLKDPDERQKYIKQMVDDQRRAQKIDEVMDALSRAPEDLQTQSNLEKLLEETAPLLDDPTEEFQQYYNRRIVKLFGREIKIAQIQGICAYLSRSLTDDNKDNDQNAVTAICLALDIHNANIADWYEDIIEIFSSEDATTRQSMEKLHDLMVFIQKRERTEAAAELVHFLDSNRYDSNNRQPRLKEEIVRYFNEYGRFIQEIIDKARGGKESLLEEAVRNRLWNPDQSIVLEWENRLRRLAGDWRAI
jgi:hypothetical protein